MGTVVGYEKLALVQEAMISRLLIYYNEIRQSQEIVSVSVTLAQSILACNPKRRSMKLAQIFNSVLDQYPEGVIIKDIDVMFNPEYQVDVLKILIEARKRKKYCVIWPGKCENGKLIYGEEGYPDYKVFDIADYDITCVI